MARIRALRDRFWQALREDFGDDIVLNGHPEHRLPNTLNISIDGVRGHELLTAVPEIAASTGSACHSGTHTPSPVLRAMGLDDARSLSALRLSIGRWTTPDDVDRAAEALIAAARRGAV